MGAIIVIVIIGAVIFLYAYSQTTSSKKSTSKFSRQSPGRTSPSQKTGNEMDRKKWLQERWRLAEEHRQSGVRSIFPDWYFDEMTDRQRVRLERDGIKVKQKLTKGQASDLIGLKEPAEAGQLEILRFFKAPRSRNLTETDANHQIALLFQDPENRKKWDQRPPTQMQREEASFFGVKLPKGTTRDQAAKLISGRQKEMDHEDPRYEEWFAMESIIEELWDTDSLKDLYEIKKPSISLIRSALEELKKEGKNLKDLESDMDAVVKKLLVLRPDLKRD